MAVNLGSAAVEAINNLRINSDFQQVKTALNEQMSKYMHAAVEAGTADACGYARALRDLVVFIGIAEAPSAPRQQKPAVQLDQLTELVEQPRGRR